MASLLPSRLRCNTARGGPAGTHIDKFSFFFAFYGLILGLAVAELLNGFAGMVRAHARFQHLWAPILLATYSAVD